MFTLANVPLILLLVGCIALLAGLSGGGIKFKDYSIPKIATFPRVMSSVIGLALIGGATWLYARPATPVPTATPTAAPLPSATVMPTPVDTFTPPPSPTATETVGPGTPTPVPPSATPIVLDPHNPAGFLAYFFDLVTVHRNYGDAWQLMTKRFQKANYPSGYVSFGSYWSGISQVDINSLQVTQLTVSSVDCKVDLTFHTAGGLTNPVTTTYRLIFDSSLQTWMFDMP